MSSDAYTPTAAADETGVTPPRFVDPGEAFDSIQAITGRKWNLRIVYHLLESGPLGFSDLKDALDGVSSKMLSESLSLLEEHRLVCRELVSDQPVRVEYSLTECGAALRPAVNALLWWDAEFDHKVDG
ncbi:winged helix-turn-helix transcriptional regulator [Halapricum desulfuricans]|uniref:DNA-binding transcriptional regulator, HxlR family n=1 Tax=Halapricum desulfuricans TaxID=2841257 RepID=A0A897NAN1_9EURY|nr:winged helix-turn-helix transcriptional regulator [Halapricum desulfuricans]QSG09428.1 DNA-binding transcriptional regulator, HxlR family [Halapricum desulfuricans]